MRKSATLEQGRRSMAQRMTDDVSYPSGARSENARSENASYDDAPEVHRRPETKTFLATSEFWVFAIAAAAVFFATYVRSDLNYGTAWKYAVWLAIGYIASRGLAKAGSQRSYEETWRRH